MSKHAVATISGVAMLGVLVALSVSRAVRLRGRDRLTGKRLIAACAVLTVADAVFLAPLYVLGMLVLYSN